MGRPDVDSQADAARRRVFTQAVLRDLRALEYMVADSLIESGVRRIGAEQEMFLVRRCHNAAPAAMEVLEGLDERFTTELGRFNMELNLPPLDFSGDCLGRLERDLHAAIATARKAAAAHGADVVLTGILPTLRRRDLHLDRMSPVPRYAALNEALSRCRGSDFELRLRGTDEISIKHDSVMLEACNTSFQVHFQVSPDEFARVYNIAQVVAAPLLAAAGNSPLLFGKRLWHETRIAVFEQSIDTRRPTQYLQERAARVSFGDRWVERSIAEIYKDDIARFRMFLAMDVSEDPFEQLAAGRVPRLEALGLQNGTVYRWNRPCYGTSGGRAHLRIENRILPSGPTVLDEVANAAFWFGLLCAFGQEVGDVTKRIGFDEAKANFIAAARVGLDAHFRWLDGRRRDAVELLRRDLLPAAQRGLETEGLAATDVDRYLTVIDRRVATRRTGAEWLRRSYASMQGKGTAFQRMRALVAAMAKRQKENLPVHEWDNASLDEAGECGHNYERVGQFMTTDVMTVHEDEVIDLVANIMAWRKIRHVPVENDQHRLVGIVSSHSLLRHIAEEVMPGAPAAVPVSRVMERNPVTVSPETRSVEAIEIMRRAGVGCLPVVDGDRLVGIVSEHDFMAIAEALLRSAGFEEEKEGA